MRLYSFHKKVQPLLDFLNSRNLDWKISSVQDGFHVLFVHDSIGETFHKKAFFDLIERHSFSYSYSSQLSSYLIF